LKMDLKILRKELKTLSEKHPVSDLWTSIFFLLDEYEAELRKEMKKWLPYHRGQHIACTACSEIRVIKKILGEEAFSE